MIPIEIEATIQQQAHQVNKVNKLPELVAFAHAALFSPAITTLKKAIDMNFLHDFPGLTSESIGKYPPSSIAMIKGHLDQSRQKKQRRTKRPEEIIELLPTPTDNTMADPDETDSLDAFPEALAEAGRTHYVYAATVTASRTSGQVYSDQTGRFPHTGSSGATQLFVLYDYDSNSIHAIPMKSKSGEEIVKAYTLVFNQLKSAGLKPLLHRLDNECSTSLREYMSDNDVQVQLVPPGMHRANSAERAIRTFKNHLTAGLCSTDPSFPVNLWEKIIPQAVISLNLLRASRINPKLSAYAQIFGQFSYNATPIGPPGTHVLVHVKPDIRDSWAPHATDGWYIGPAMHHRRCYRTIIWETKGERISDTVTWLPKLVALPQLSPTETIISCTKQIVEALLKVENVSPSDSLASNQNHILALERFNEILTKLPEHTVQRVTKNTAKSIMSFRGWKLKVPPKSPKQKQSQQMTHTSTRTFSPPNPNQFARVSADICPPKNL